MKLTNAETRLALFQAVAKSVNSSLILEEIFDALGEVLRTFIPFQSGSIVILDDTQNRSKVVVTLDESGYAEIHGDNKIFAGYDALIDRLLKSPEAMRLDDTNIESVLVDSQCRQAIISPLISKGLVIGCIGLSGEEYDELHVQLLSEVGEQIAVAVENARLYWQTQSQAGREFLVNQITKSIRQSLDIQSILETTVQEVGRVMGVSRCLIHYWRDDGPWFEHFEYVLPGGNRISDPMAMAHFEREVFSGRAASPQQYNPFILNDSRNYEKGKALLEQEDIKSLAVFPILLQDKNFVGVMVLQQCETYRAWLGEEMELMQAIAEHVAVALHQASLFQEKENQRRQLENALTELQQAQMHLVQSEKMAVLGQFVAGIAHEVNTPLGTIISNDDTVKRCIEKMNVDEAGLKFQQSALELLKVNQMAGDRIQEIVRNLRNFVRLDESDLKPADLHEGLDTTLLLMYSVIKDRIEIIKHYGELPQVECFPGLLNQVFMNLLVNASHAIEGKGSITIETHHLAFSQQVEVLITDTGKGIAPENLSRIFDPGFTTKGVGVGTGLGLALCYKIVEKHGGTIRIDSTVGQGTTATVVIPVRHKPAQ